MAIITSAYFRGKLELGLGTDDLSNVDSTWIPQLENEYLYKLLGYGFARDFIDGIAAVTPAQKWVDIRDGKEYTVSGKRYNWVGLKDTTTYISPIANYIYCMYMIDNASQTTSLGETSNNVQNALRVSAGNKIHIAWVDMIAMHDSLYHFLNNNTTTYDTWVYSDVQEFGSLNAFSI